MRSASFLIHGEAPWGESLVIHSEEFEQARQEILGGKFVDAGKTLRKILDEEFSTDTDKLWANILLSYVRRLTSCMHSKREKEALKALSTKHYVDACRVNKDIAYEEVSGQAVALSWLEQLLLIPQKKTEKPSFADLHEQIWRTFFIDNLCQKREHQEVIDSATLALTQLPMNHFMLFTRAASLLCKGMKEVRPDLLLQAEADLTAALTILPRIPESKDHCSRYFFHRAQVRYYLCDMGGTLADFHLGMLADGAKNEAFDHGFRRNVLGLALTAQEQRLDDESRLNSRKFNAAKTLTTSIRADIAKREGLSKCDLFIQRAELYEAAGHTGRAGYEYAIAAWQLNTHMSYPNPKKLKALEEKITQLKAEVRQKANARLEEKKAESKETEEEKQNKKRAKRDRQKLQKAEEKKEEEQKKLVHDFVSGIFTRVISSIEREERQAQEEKRKNEEERQAKIKADQDAERERDENDKKTIRHLLSGMLDTIELSIEEQERQERQEREEKEENARQLEFQKQQEAQARKEILEQEVIIFNPEKSIVIPEEIADFIRALKALPGRLSQRCYPYGGSVRDQVMEFKRDSGDYDIRAALPLEVVANELKNHFQLSQAPKVEHNLVQVTIPIQDETSGTQKTAVLAVSHSDILANEELSYTEAVREDVLDLDFVQNAFVAMVPEKGSVCPAYYPLAWWDIYFSQDVQKIAKQLEHARNADGLVRSLTWLRGNAIFLVGAGLELRVYHVRKNATNNNHPLSIVPLNFTISLQEGDNVLLGPSGLGRVRTSPQTQARLKEILDSINVKNLEKYKKPFDSRKTEVISRLGKMTQLGTIRNATDSFRQDPIRMLRAIHLSTALGCSWLNPFVCTGISNNSRAFQDLIKDSPGKLNSWFNKLLCKDGKPCLVENMNYLNYTGLLAISFPELTKAFNNNTCIDAWLAEELSSISTSDEKPSLNYLYCVFVVCASAASGGNMTKIIKSNPLWDFNFKDFPPTSLLNKASNKWRLFRASWQQPMQLAQVNVHVTVDVHNYHLNSQNIQTSFYTSNSAISAPVPVSSPSPTQIEGDGSKDSPGSDSDEQQPGMPRKGSLKGG